MLEFNIAWFFSYGLMLCILCGFIPVAMAGCWHILKMI